MDYNTALEKLHELRDLLEKDNEGTLSDEERPKLPIAYGKVEEIIHRMAGVTEVSVPVGGDVSETYSNFIEAGYLSSRTIHQHAGYTQLLKVIGKVEQLAEDPTVLQVEPSITHLIQVIRNFRECCQYIKSPPMTEKDVQDILWIMLRSNFQRVEREESLPTFGTKGYKPDFGIPDLRVLVEVKFVGEKARVQNIQEEILADIPGYLNDSTQFEGLVVLVYDAAQKLRDAAKFVDDIKSVDGIIEVVVVPGIG